MCHGDRELSGSSISRGGSMLIRRLRRSRLAMIAALVTIAASSVGVAHAADNYGTVIPADYAGATVVGIGSDQPGTNKGAFPAPAMKSIRLWDDSFAWCNLEPHPGVWNEAAFKSLSDDVNYARSPSQGYTQIILTLGMTPAWAVPGASPQATGCLSGTQTQAPDGYAAWDQYIAEVSFRFTGRITAYEVWNEPGLPQYWTGGAAALGQFTAQAFYTIKARDPNAQVLSGSLTPRTCSNTRTLCAFDSSYLQELRYDSWPVDGIAFHSYSGYSGPGPLPAGAETAATLLQQHGDQVSWVIQGLNAQSPPRAFPLWETEVNHDLNVINGVRQLHDPLASGAQVQVVGRTFLDDIVWGVNHEVWYGWNADKRTDASTHFLGVPLENDNQAVGALVLRTMTSWTAGHTYLGCYNTTTSGVAVHYCYFDGREIAYSAHSVTIPGLNGCRSTLPDGLPCTSATNITLTPTPQLIVYQ